jgi:hypothetical protein
LEYERTQRVHLERLRQIKSDLPWRSVDFERKHSLLQSNHMASRRRQATLQCRDIDSQNRKLNESITRQTNRPIQQHFLPHARASPPARAKTSLDYNRNVDNLRLIKRLLDTRPD